ncbi:MAG: FecR domain-containing protein [Bacteroidota bacterium]
MPTMREKSALIKKFLKGTLSKRERDQLKNWVLRDKDNLEEFKNRIRAFSKDMPPSQFDEKKAKDKFLTVIGRKHHNKGISKMIMRYAAIFAGLVLVSYGVYFFTRPVDIPTLSSDTVIRTEQDGVTITLGDGTQQMVPENGHRLLTDEEGKAVAKIDGKSLDFRDFDAHPQAFDALHTIYVPYGQTFSITLSEGSKVWLNSGSTLKFPHFFAPSAQRKVFLMGEGFFDVAKDAERPFIVRAENVDVEVLGTRFNVSAYGTESNITTTLVEGSVNVFKESKPEDKVLLYPNHQAAFAKEKGTFALKKVNTKLYTSWMENKLVIDHLSFQEILDRLERSYNVTIINTVDDLNAERYMGEFENETLDTILHTIAASTPFTFVREGGIITISE